MNDKTYRGVVLTGLCWFCLFVFFCSVVYAETARVGPSVDFNHGRLKVSENRRFLIHEDGAPFFYLGDTAWELFHRLNREEADRYLENRRQKGFTVIQAVLLAEPDGLDTPNAYSHRPLINNEPTRPNEDYFKHVDYIVNKAKEKGIYIGMLPTWGDKVTKAWGKGPVTFNEENAKVYGRFLGSRYKDAPNIIWVLGGDRVADKVEHIWRAMAEGIKEGDNGLHLMSYHPQGGRSSAEWFHNDNWLDFNMLQSGHDRFDNPNYEKISKDYSRIPAKPCLDGEPRYEDHPVNWNPQNGWFNDFDVRQGAYWSLFAGAFGHTYGCHDIWQMYAPGRTPISSARNYWYDVLDLAGAEDMMHVRNLMESRPFLARVPDQSVIVSQPPEDTNHIQATRGDDYLFVYIPTGKPVTIQMGKISGEKVKGWWFNPRTGESQFIAEFPNTGSRQFSPSGTPGRGNDWVLVLDDAAKNFPPPGQPAARLAGQVLTDKNTKKLMQLPDVKFYLFGMGNRRKFLYKDGTLFDARTGEVFRKWQVSEEKILPSQYSVRLKTSDGKTIVITEDEQAVWFEEGKERFSLTKWPIHLPKFEGHPFAGLLRILLHEMLINIVDTKPVPNFFVYSKPWYRDGAMVAMCLQKTDNLHLIKPWILQLSDPFDRNNAGHQEADNLGQVLYLISLVADSSHPLVDKVLRTIPQFQKDKHIAGMTDFSEHPVYQTKWLKFGLRALHLDDPYEIPKVFDSYSALFWMDFKDAHVPGSSFAGEANGNYPYLAWAEAHFHNWPPPMSPREQYSLTWEANASQAKYDGMKLISQEYVDRKICAPHSWHAAEMFLFLLAQKP
jgi:hypothetical protein